MENALAASKSQAPFVPNNTMGSVESNRAIAEVQGQVLMAKQFPRDQIQARLAILEACKRKRLAETAIYSYPRGGAQIEGPSIRLAEMMAQNWGNLDFGIVELEQRPGKGKIPGESLVMAYAKDLQTNTKQQIVFNVPHVRYTRARGNKPLDDPRDIYEVMANMGARRLRKCILGIIPGDIVEEAVDACNKTMIGSGGEPLIDRIKKMVKAFEGVGVTQAMVEKRLGHKMEATLVIEVVKLGKIYKSIQDGMSSVDEWFGVAKAQKEEDKTKTETPFTKKEPTSQENLDSSKAPENPDSSEAAPTDSKCDAVKRMNELLEDPAYENAASQALTQNYFKLTDCEQVTADNDAVKAQAITDSIKSFIK